MSGRRGKTLAIWGVASALFIVAGLLAWLKPWVDSSSDETKTFPLPPFSTSPYLNTGPDAHYIGIAACAACHPRQHQSYLHTAHSRALGDVDLDDEPPDASFVHAASGRSYRVYRHDGVLRHEELLRTADGKEIARLDLPIRYRIGSGNFTRSYLVEIDGFLHESPITWYTSKKKWDMSPGYDMPNHLTFERPVDTVCLTCHAGRIDAVDSSVHRMKLHEQAIGCENCHGPGSLHQERHRGREWPAGEPDLTIVNPGKLSRRLLESICAVCHQTGAATTLVRGRDHTSFRPGRPLTDYRIDYEVDVGNEQMTVVGHMEQLRHSKCYQSSPDMNCLTCHNPHQRDKPAEPIQFYRQKCLSCHTAQSCRLDMTKRLAKEPADSCVVCHMPRGDTDIPHIAFTHHRIGRHLAPPKPPDRVPEVVPIDDVTHLPLMDRQRNLGLAYVLVAQKPEFAPFAQEFRKRGKDLLEKVHAAGLRADESAAALVELYQEVDSDRARDYAKIALRAPGMPAFLRANVQFGLASAAAHDVDFAGAIAELEELTRRRRQADDWRLLGIAHLELNDPQKALPAFQRALAIRPFRPATHFGLAETHRRLGDDALARQHQFKGQWLIEHRQD